MTDRSKTIIPWVYALLVLLPAILLFLTGQMGNIVPFHIAARFCAVTGFAILFLQPVLSARFHWIERHFGLDRMLLFHRCMGIVACLLAILHPVFLALGSRTLSLFLNFDSPWQITAGRAVFLLLIFYGAAAVFRAALRIPFQLWFRLHNAGTLPILTGVFLHSWFIAVRNMPVPVQAVWFVLGSFSLYSYLHLTLFRRISARLSSWSVTGVEKVTRNVWEFTLEPPKGKRSFDYFPGQFMFLTFLRGRGLPVEEHPFTISSRPGAGNYVSVGIKESGDFTSTIGKTKPGDRAALIAPYGRFSYLLHPRVRNTVFVAGGIGITPILSMLRHMNEVGFDSSVFLFYGNRTEEDIAFRDELESIEPLTLVKVLSSPGKDWKGETGWVCCAMMGRYLEDLTEAVYYVCGPPPMMDAMNTDLMINGVSSENIHMERFSL